MLKLLIGTQDVTPYLQIEGFDATLKSTNKDSLSFVLKTNEEIQVGKEVKLYLNDKLVFGGLLQIVSPVVYSRGVGVKPIVLVNCTCGAYTQRCNHRTCSVWYNPLSETQTKQPDGSILVEYTGTYANEIVTSIYNSALKDEGFILGTIDKGAEIKEWTKLALTVADALDDLSRVSGVNWTITKDKVLHFTKSTTMNQCSRYISTEKQADNIYTGIVNLQATYDIQNYRNRQRILGINSTNEKDVTLGTADNTAEITEMATRFGTGVYGNIFEDEKVIRKVDADVLAQQYLKAYGGIPATVSFTTYGNDNSKDDFLPNTILYVHAPCLYIKTPTLFYIHTVTISLAGGKIVRNVQATKIKEDIQVGLPNGDVSTFASTPITTTQPVSQGWADDIGKLKTKTGSTTPIPKTKLSDLIGANLTDTGFSAKFTDGEIEATYDLDAEGNITTIKIKDGQTITIR